MATVTNLKSSTSLSSGRSNAPVIVPPDEKAIKAQAIKAFRENTSGIKSLGTAWQRMTYAVMCEHALLVKANKEIGFLKDIDSSPETKSNIVQRMVAAFTDGKPDLAGLGDDAKGLVNQAFQTEQQLVKRGVELAAILDAHNLNFTAFNDKAGMFSVPATLLYPKGEAVVPYGRLADADPILLDNRSIVYLAPAKNGKPKAFFAKASVAQIKAINKPVKPRAAGGAAKKTEASNDKGDGKPAFNPKNVKEVAGAINPETMMLALELVFVKEAPAEIPMKSDFPKGFPALSNVMQKFDEWRQAWAKAEADKLTNKPA